ncbi:MAG: hypothetical protein JW729_05020, partial [Bacteroidales bacterium]|nr:hypothetical protein [Bacteroidales bacterium]
AYQVYEKLQLSKSIEKVSQWCCERYHISPEESTKSVQAIHAIISGELNTEKKESPKKKIKVLAPTRFYSQKSYQYRGVGFTFFYGNAQIETMFHPLFAHLEVNETSDNFQLLYLFSNSSSYYLKNAKTILGSWKKNEDHIFKGQVFMAFLNQVHNKTDRDWMGVLHASAIGMNQKSVLFLGDSGNGKSTASAIALADGLSLLADDFVPIDTFGQVLNFPAAISVKKQSLKMLSERFPELLKAKEYELKAMNKTVRYLAPNDGNENPSSKTKALVFIKFDPETEFKLEAMDKHLAFQQLVVDAWISPHEANARFFLHWMAEIPTYRLVYSNNEKMLDAVRKLLD